MRDYIARLFIFYGTYTSYAAAVTFLAAATSATIAIFFVIYIADALHIKDTFELFFELKILIFLSFLYHALDTGMFLKFKIPGISSTSRTINRSIIVDKTVRVKDNLSNNEYLALLNAINHFPIHTSLMAAIEIFLISGTVYLMANSESNAAEIHSYILICAPIALFIVSGFNFIIADIITGPMRTQTKWILYSHGITYQEKSRSSVKYKGVFFILLFIIALYTTYLLASNLENNSYSIASFAIIIIFVCSLMSYLLFYGIFQSISEVQLALSNLKDGGDGIYFPATFDKEFINLSAGINGASTTVRDYRRSLEKKVIERTTKLENANKELRKIDLEILTELNFAAEIQQGMIPGREYSWGPINISTSYIPMNSVSGDYFDFFEFKDHLYILLCDVSGHGVPAALVTMLAKQAFSRYCSRNLNPAEIFRKVNNELLKQVKTQDYLTAYMLRISDTGKLTYGNAAHPRVLLLNNQSDNLLSLDTEGLFIGSLSEANKYYEDKTLQLKSGDRLFLYTDGITEQVNELDIPYGTDRLIQLLLKNRDKSIQQMKEIVIADVHSYANKATIDDDLTFMSIEFSPNFLEFVTIFNNGLKEKIANRFDSAMLLFQKAESLLPKHSKLQYQLANVLLKLNRWSHSYAMFEHIVELPWYKKQVLEKQIVCLVKMKDIKQATFKLNQLKELDSSNSKINTLELLLK